MISPACTCSSSVIVTVALWNSTVFLGATPEKVSADHRRSERLHAVDRSARQRGYPNTARESTKAPGSGKRNRHDLTNIETASAPKPGCSLQRDDARNCRPRAKVPIDCRCGFIEIARSGIIDLQLSGGVRVSVDEGVRSCAPRRFGSPARTMLPPASARVWLAPA